MLKGALDAEGFSDVTRCVTDGVTILKDSQIAVQDFEQGTADSVVAGLKELAEILTVSQSALKDCASLKADWKRLSEMAAIFSSPSSFAYHVGKDLIINGRQIYSEVNNAITDYHSAQWQDFGYNVGMAAAKLIVGDKPVPAPVSETKKEKFAKFVQGVIAKFGGHFDITNLLLCIYQEDQALMLLDAAYEQFVNSVHDKNLQEAIAGVIMTIGAVKQAEQGLPVCKAIDTTSWDYAGLKKSAEIMSDPLKHFQIVGTDLLINGKSIVKDVSDTTSAWQNGQWELAGEALGDILKLSTTSSKQYPPQEWLQERKVFEKFETIDRKDVTSFAQAFIESSGVGHFDFSALLACI